LRVVLQFPLYHPINPEFRPNVDGRVIVDNPKKLFARGQFAKVPFIIGTVRDEFGMPTSLTTNTRLGL